MPATNNPAGRLLAILAEADKVCTNQMSLRQAWGVVCGVDPADTPQILYTHALLMSLVGETRQCIQSLNGVDKALYLKPVETLEKAFSHFTIESTWAQVQQFMKNTLEGLAFCADTLSREMPEEVIAQETLDELKAEIDALFDEIFAADVAPELKAIILDHLESIRRAVAEYRIRGTRGLRTAVDGSIMALLRHQGELENVGDKGWVSRLNALMHKADRVAALGTAAKKMYGHLSQLLQLGN